MINLIYFTAVIACAVSFNHPMFVAVAYLCAFTYSVKLKKLRAFIFNLVLIVFIGVYAMYYSSYNHFGVTNLWSNFIDNYITLESVVYGAVLGVIISTVVMWMSCVHAIVSSDKIIYLFGRVVPKLSLFLSIILRTVPRIKSYARKVNISQSCIGRGVSQGNIFYRIKNAFRMVSAIVTWTLENFIESSQSMKNRGYELKGRTAFSIYRFDARDRSFVITIFINITVIIMGVLFEQTKILYNPEIIFNRITPLSSVFYIAYMFLCLLPMILQTAGERKFARLRMSV